MNKFKQRRAVMECKSMMQAGACPRSCKTVENPFAGKIMELEG